MGNQNDEEPSMFIILGGTGHVGSAVATELLAQRQPVTIVTRNGAGHAGWRERGAQIAVADVADSDALRRIFRTGKRAFLLNPPAPVSTDTDAEESKTVASIVAALEGSGLEKVVAESAYGAQPGRRCGDLSILHDLEQALASQPIPFGIVRAAYYFSNWDSALATARDEGVLHTMFPPDFELPMVAPDDLGRFGAHLLASPIGRIGTHHVEGPERYSSNDVAAAFSAALGKPVRVATAPRERWLQAYREMGFSEAAADSYARMTAATLDNPFMAEEPVRGFISLPEYIENLVRKASG
jgi:uncharacterized protein YbjT (DUF2867 family)